LGTSPEKKTTEHLQNRSIKSASIRIYHPSNRLDSQIIIGEAVDPSGVTFEGQKRLKSLVKTPNFCWGTPVLLVNKLLLENTVFLLMCVAQFF